jgi:hypothetical protein
MRWAILITVFVLWCGVVIPLLNNWVYNMIEGE